MVALNPVSNHIWHREGESSYVGIRVNETTSELAILELCSNSGADTKATAANLCAAGAPAVGIRYASAGRELLALAVTDILSTGIIGSESNGGNGD